MHTRRFFIFATLLPYFLVLFGLALANIISTSNFFTISYDLVAAVVLPYGIFAVLICSWYLKTPVSIVRYSSYRLPIFYLIVQGAYFIIAYWYGVSYLRDYMALGSIIIFVSMYIVILGYLYVFLAEQCYISYVYQIRRQNIGRYSPPLISVKSPSENSYRTS